MPLNSLVSVIGLGVVVFITTDIDDLLLLSAFFADQAIHTRAIVLGQFAGIGALTAISIVAALFALAVPEGWVGLLGVLPLALGLRGLHTLWRARRDGGTSDIDEAEADEAATARSAPSPWVGVAAVTIANGGDNLGVYIPLFSHQPSWIPVYVVVFAVMTALWCAAGFWLVNHALIGARIRRYGHVALPFVLIALGLVILSDALVLFR